MLMDKKNYKIIKSLNNVYQLNTINKDGKLIKKYIGFKNK